jgi:hypothetical protein
MEEVGWPASSPHRALRTPFRLQRAVAFGDSLSGESAAWPDAFDGAQARLSGAAALQGFRGA